MSITKRMMEENEDRGFCADESITVCTNCFDDIGVKKFIETNGPVDGECDYCCKDLSGVTSDFDTVMGHIMGSIYREWGHPEDEGVSYITREGGWQVKTIDTWDLFAKIGFEANNHDLTELIYNSINVDLWCKRNPYSLSNDKVYSYGWESFSEFVLHEARYVFFKTKPTIYDEEQHDEMNPVDILNSLSIMVKELNLISSIKMEQNIYRVRIVDETRELKTAEELGSPPINRCVLSNRMSPAGIAMFYGSFSVEAAIKETYDSSMADKKKIAACGVFQPFKELNMLDLTKIPTVPSLFDENSYGNRDAIIFLRDFLEDFTKPISRNNRAHVEYVPTQIVTEYFRHCFLTENNKKLDGVIYPSSKDSRQSSLVIFANNNQCRKMVSEWRITETQILKMIKAYDIKL